MALKAVVESLDGMDDGSKSLYVERDGKFILDVEPVGGFSLEDVTGLKTALGKERTAREQAERLTAAFKDIDPAKAREALAKVSEWGNLDPTLEADKIANTKFEAAKAQLLEKHAAEIAERENRVGHLSKTVESLLIDQVATAALAEAKGSVELLLPHVRAHTRVKEVDGKFTVEVVDRDGNARIANSKGETMDIKGLVADMKASETFSRAFEASGNSGSGKVPSNGATPAVTKGNFGGDKSERIAAIAARFPELAKN